MFLNRNTVLNTLRKISPQINPFLNSFVLKCNNICLQHSKNKIPRFNKIVIGLGVIGLPFVPKVTAESEPNIHNLNKTEDVIVNNSAEKSNVIEKTGWERLCAMYEFDEFGNASKEMNATFQATGIACIVGLLYGGVTSSKAALVDFMERNQASIYENPLDAKRRLQNHVTIHFGKGAFRWASKLTIFTGGFMLFLTSMSVYRGGYNVIDYGISGAVMGSISRFRLGPPAMTVGGVLGGVLGMLCGLMTKTLLSLTGQSIDEVISFQYDIQKKRKDLYMEGVSKSLQGDSNKEVLDLLKVREQDKKEKGI